MLKRQDACCRVECHSISSPGIRVGSYQQLAFAQSGRIAPPRRGFKVVPVERTGPKDRAIRFRTALSIN